MKGHSVGKYLKQVSNDLVVSLLVALFHDYKQGVEEDQQLQHSNVQVGVDINEFMDEFCSQMVSNFLSHSELELSSVECALNLGPMLHSEMTKLVLNLQHSQTLR